MTDDSLSHVAKLSEGCVRFVQEKIGLEVDYSQDTLPLVDHYLKEMPETESEEVILLASACVGAYFGEVLRRHIPGLRWHAPEEDYASWRLECAHAFLHFNPIGAAREAIFGEAQAGWNAHFSLLPEDAKVIAEVLDRSLGAREDDYYRLALRYESVELVLDVLAQRARDNNEGSAAHFGPELYAREVELQREQT